MEVKKLEKNRLVEKKEITEKDRSGRLWFATVQVYKEVEERRRWKV